MNRSLKFMWSFVVKVFSKNDTLNSALDSCSDPSPEKPRSHRSREAKKPRVTKPLKPRSHRSQEAKSHETTKAEKPTSPATEAEKPRSQEPLKPRS